MKLVSILTLFTTSLLAVADIIPSAILPGGASLPVKLLPDYLELYKMCTSSSIKGTYVAVRYKGKNYNTFKYNQCYPYKINGNLAEMAVFCESVTCYGNPNPDCSGGAVPPVPIPLPAGLTLINVADFVQLLGQGATCQQNGLGI